MANNNNNNDDGEDIVSEVLSIKGLIIKFLRHLLYLRYRNTPNTS